MIISRSRITLHVSSYIKVKHYIPSFLRHYKHCVYWALFHYCKRIELVVTLLDHKTSQGLRKHPFATRKCPGKSSFNVNHFFPVCCVLSFLSVLSIPSVLSVSSLLYFLFVLSCLIMISCQISPQMTSLKSLNGHIFKVVWSHITSNLLA